MWSLCLIDMNLYRYLKKYTQGHGIKKNRSRTRRTRPPRVPDRFQDCSSTRSTTLCSNFCMKCTNGIQTKNLPILILRILHFIYTISSHFVEKLITLLVHEKYPYRFWVRDEFHRKFNKTTNKCSYVFNYEFVVF